MDNLNDTKLICTACGAENNVGTKFCIKCGVKLEQKEASDEIKPEEKPQSAFEPVKEEKPQSAFKPISEQPAEAKEPEKSISNTPAFQSVEEPEPVAEKKSVFAEGLPEWSIEPPMVVVRRNN